ncbi:hypothetical protein PM3016_2734 [Paenibacillus mucilaginosus 3016]|uniref:Uncharacterized protein n=2 Tax=Paenibacillus mucilaginosus TaxID=61624 RepID=H6NHL5_9BACL|nr:hypothetical protein [Paenibacillus mucilaginosus]AFC29612.1 hypothetical protein PM3016_2734 [Paenibacillus mucilaginosus 3016]AFH61788.1 hypothetical protein B2K_13850 [Paenibacillus mucilaginosus K02]WFA18295.1 hypothetical protein ERY13_13965 [Paenibacillus mucilaginosus]
MSEHRQVVEEQYRMNAYLAQGYLIGEVAEGLSGTRLVLHHPQRPEERQVMHLLTAEARRTLGCALMKQLGRA